MSTLSPGERMFVAAADAGEPAVAEAIQEVVRRPEEIMHILMTLWTRGIEVGVRLADLHPEVVRDFLAELDDGYPDEIRGIRDDTVEAIAAAGRTT